MYELSTLLVYLFFEYHLLLEISWMSTILSTENEGIPSKTV